VVLRSPAEAREQRAFSQAHEPLAEEAEAA
jgi:hypothetical protein